MSVSVTASRATARKWFWKATIKFLHSARVGSFMSRFRAYEGGYDSAELAIFEQAYEDACRKLGVDPSPTDDTVYRRLRDDSRRR